jgi:hypothetical protein
METLKISKKSILVISGILALIVIGFIVWLLWSPRQTKLEINDSSVVTQPKQQTEIIKDAKTAIPVKATTSVTTLNNETPEEPNKPVIKTGETLMQKYLRITNSSEYKTEFEKATASYEADYNNWNEKAKALYQKRKEIQNDLAKSSDENKAEIKKELESVESDFKVAIINAAGAKLKAINSGDSVKLKYFKPDEYYEALFQMTKSGKMKLGTETLKTKEQREGSGTLISAWDYSEAEKQLNAKGFKTRVMPPPSEAIIKKYVGNVGNN